MLLSFHIHGSIHVQRFGTQQRHILQLGYYFHMDALEMLSIEVHLGLGLSCLGRLLSSTLLCCYSHTSWSCHSTRCWEVLTYIINQVVSRWATCWYIGSCERLIDVYIQSLITLMVRFQFIYQVLHFFLIIILQFSSKAS